VQEEGKYYLYGTGWHLPDGSGFMTYTSSDLKTWEGPFPVFRRPEGFWSDRNYWAPEVHRYNGKYYMFASFKAKDICRGTQILVSEAASGPFCPMTEGPVTPRDWECLDGTLHIDESGKPWMVFCHEWVQVGDGEMCAIMLSDDLKTRTGEPVLLFRASEASWVTEIGKKPRGRVTDGPFLHQMRNGTLIMLWSSFGKGGYKLAVARSESGQITGPWKHEPKPIFENDGGHGMILRTFEGKLLLVLHQPNRGPDERPRLFTVQEKEHTLVISEAQAAHGRPDLSKLALGSFHNGIHFLRQSRLQR
jgi:beta-xylosidase